MTRTQGLLVALEGVDGSGKHTQAVGLQARLQARGLQTALYTFPDYERSRLGPSLREMLAGAFGPAGAIHPRLSAPLFALERSEKRDAICADLDAGKVVLCDRYVYSNVAHQACRLPDEERPAFRRWLEEIEFDVLGMPRPDLTFLLDADDRLSAQRREQRAREAGDARPLDDYERDDGGIARARRIYLDLAEALRWAVVPVMEHGEQLDRETVTGRMFARMEPYLPAAD